MVAAPVAVGANAEKMYVGVMLQRDPQTQRLYLHDAVAEKEPASQTGGHLSTTGPGGSESELYTTNILRNDLNVKKNNEGSSTRRSLHADVTQSTKSGESNAQPSTNSIRSGNEKNKSRPVWGAWIEMAVWTTTSESAGCRAPYGARGLKLAYWNNNSFELVSRPVWGAWIEISCLMPVASLVASRPV